MYTGYKIPELYFIILFNRGFCLDKSVLLIKVDCLFCVAMKESENNKKN